MCRARVATPRLFQRPWNATPGHAPNPTPHRTFSAPIAFDGLFASTSSYEQAVAAPEKLDANDERLHLTDGQLRDPMHGVLAGCRVPPNAKVTIRTAVQYGRAIGVTVDVRFEHPKSAKRPSPAATKREAKAIRTVATCVDRGVRNVVWPPSNRRDTFTTEF